MLKPAIPVQSVLIRSMSFLPYLSPNIPNIRAPIGIAKYPAAYVPYEQSIFTNSSELPLKKTSAIITVKNPYIAFEKDCTACPYDMDLLIFIVQNQFFIR